MSKKTSRVSRRSFVALVTGAAASTMIVSPAQAQRTGRTDSDPDDSSGYGRTGYTDSDPNDRSGFGRSGLTDGDDSDRARYGRGRGTGR